MSKAKVTLPDFRISLASVGRRLTSVLLRANNGELTEEEFFDTINAVFDSCVAEDSVPDPEAEVNHEVLSAEQAEIEKSVRRSAAARKAAERRRQLREARQKASEAGGVTIPTSTPKPTTVEEITGIEPEAEPQVRHYSRYPLFPNQRARGSSRR